MQWVYLNGAYMPVEHARLSPLDRGFLLGDGAFETIRIIQGQPYLLAEHLARLQETLQRIRLIFETDSLYETCNELVRRNHIADGILRITISRGEGGFGYAVPKNAHPSVFLHCRLLGKLPETATARLSTWRKIPPQCLPTEGKTLQTLNAILARMEATEDGESLQLDMHGHLASFSSGNLFWQSEGVWHTPSLSTGCLAGITRNRIMELWNQPILPVEVTLDALQGADAVILTNSRVLATAITSLTDYAWSFPESVCVAQNLRALLESDALAMR